MKSPGKKSLTNKLDKVFREIIILRDGRCQKCGRKNGIQLQCAHVYSRAIRAIRWNRHNALTLCADCHFWAHANPVDFSLWFAEKFPHRIITIKSLKQKIFKTSIKNLEGKLIELMDYYNLMKGATNAD